MRIIALIAYSIQGKKNKRVLPQGKALFSLQKKSVFYKIMRILYPYKNALWALRPAKPLGVLSRHPCRNPKPLPRGEGLCMLGWLCIVQSLLAYTPGIRAGGGIRGLASLRPALGLRPKQGCFDCLPKVLHDAKPTEQAISDTPIFRKHKGLSTD